MRKWGSLLVVFALLWHTRPVWAQQEGKLSTVAMVPDPDQEGGKAKVNAPSSKPEEKPETVTVPALSGAERFTPGGRGVSRSFLIPSIEYTGFADTNPTASGGHSQTEAQSTYIGTLTLQRVWSRSQFNLDYSGGGYSYTGPLTGTQITSVQLNGVQPATQRFSPNGMFHRLGVTYSNNRRRWQTLLADNFSYLPESPLGFAGFGASDALQGGLGGSILASSPALGSAFQPDQSIFTGLSRQLSHSATGQVQYTIGERSSVTATGSYGTLTFVDPGFIDSRYWVFQGGYNRALTQRDTLSVFYVATLFQPNVRNSDTLSRGLQVAYGHRVTGRLSFELSGGPLSNEIALPRGGSLTSSFWATYDSLQYTAGKFNADLSFSRSVTGGSGLLFSAATNMADLTLSRPLARKLGGSVHFGYIYDQSLTGQDPNQAPFKSESWLGGIILTRSLGANMNFYVQYDVQRENIADPGCFGNNCVTSFTRHIGGIGLNWHGRPIRID